MDRLVEPSDRHYNDGDTLDERGDGVCDWGCYGQDGKCDDVLAEVNQAVPEEIVTHPVSRGMRWMGHIDRR